MRIGHPLCLIRSAGAAAVAALLLGCGADPGAQGDPQMADLFSALREAPDASRADLTEKQIWARWTSSGSATVDVLLERANAAEAAGDAGLARAFLIQAADLAPAFAEPWHRRAAIAYAEQDYAGAIRAIEETLKREPRHFAAYAGLGVIYEELGQDAAALAAYREALQIHPYLTTARQGERRLSARLNGQDA